MIDMPPLSPDTDTVADDADRIRVDLGARSYDILIGAGLISDAGSYISPLMNVSKTIVVTDSNVAQHWLEPLLASLRSADIEASTLIMEPGERTKSFHNLQTVTGAFLDMPVERRSLVIALGGGVIGDLVGFAAAITLRGIDFVQIPTTLLAQVDSSVGGKTGINMPHGKNLIGAFHQPRLVITDTNTLNTLPARETCAGYAEVVKYGLIQDAAFFEWLEDNGADVLNGDDQARRHAIKQSCRSKASVVARDEYETGVRALLNFGHTFGHALEAENAYGPSLLHGEAVGIGSILALRLSERLDLCESGAAQRLQNHFQAIAMKCHVSDIGGANQWSAGRLLDHMRLDKKVSGGKMNFILARDIGDVIVTADVEESDVLAVLQESIETPSSL